MLRLKVSVFLLVILVTVQAASGMRFCSSGPQPNAPDRSSWPTGLVELARHPSRVYAIEGAGAELYYYFAYPDEINELIQLFSKTRMRDHQVRIVAGPKAIEKAIDERAIDYSVSLETLDSRFLQGGVQGKGSPETFEPVLTIFVEPEAEEEIFEAIKLPDNIILTTDLPNCPLKGKASRPERRFWYAVVRYEDDKPAGYRDGVYTKVTLWEKGVKDGITLGHVWDKDKFMTVFSDKEMADLKSGRTWMTLTSGNHRAKAQSDHLRLDVKSLTRDSKKAIAVKIPAPKFYYGRILMEDGSVPRFGLRPERRPDVHVMLPLGNRVALDSEGYFKVHYSKEQYAEALERFDEVPGMRKNIYVPDPKAYGKEIGLFTYPVSKLSQDKTNAGVVKISSPYRKTDGKR